MASKRQFKKKPVPQVRKIRIEEEPVMALKSWYKMLVNVWEQAVKFLRKEKISV